MIEPATGAAALAGITGVKGWKTGRWVVFAVLCWLPFTIYTPSELLDMWGIPLMAVCAAAIPASGAPIAGGIIFLPVLRAYGVCPRDAVAFSAATQFFGCGIFSPLNWLVQDPTVFLPDAVRVSFTPSAIGLVASLTMLKISGCNSDLYVMGIFGSFCLLLSLYVGHGLLRKSGLLKRLTKPSKLTPAPLRFDAGLACRWFVPCVLGGLLTGWIGVSIEKVLFVLLTRDGSVDVRRATITSVSLVGWLSGVATLMHMLSPCDPNAPDYVGALPYGLWIVGLPGILMGSILGPRINQAVGSTNILIGFALMLLYEGSKNVWDVYKGWDAPCDSSTDVCLPQHENMSVLGGQHIVAQFLPWLFSDAHLEYMRERFQVQDGSSLTANSSRL